MTDITGDGDHLFVPRRPQRHGGRDAWARFLARMVDVQIVVLPTFMVIAFGVGVVHGIRPIPAVATYLSAQGLPRFLMDTGLMWAVSLVVEALLISAFTGTPGKALMGVSVRKASGGKLSTPMAAWRWLMVLVMGRGAGVPIVGLVTLAKSYEDVEKTGSTSWDDMLDVRVDRKPVGWWRWTLAVLIYASLLGLSVLGTIIQFKNL